MSNVFEVSQSKIKLWRKCHYAAFLRYVEKLRKKRKARPLVFGSIVHDMIEAHVNGDDAFKVLAEYEKKQGEQFRKDREEYGEIIFDAKAIMTDYFRYYAEPGQEKVTWVRTKGKASEFTFNIQLVDGITFNGKIDRFAKAKGLRWLGETKSGKQMLNDDHRWRDLQSASYIRVNDILGLPPVDGTMWDFIRSKPPSLPQMKKDGEASKRALDTLPAALEAWSKREGIAVDAHTMKAAKQNRSAYFKRVFTPVKKKVVDQVYADLITSAIDMSERLRKMKDMNIGRHCDWCDFEPICRARLQGSDADYIKEKEYEISKGRSEPFEPDFEA